MPTSAKSSQLEEYTKAVDDYKSMAHDLSEELVSAENSLNGCEMLLSKKEKKQEEIKEQGNKIRLDIGQSERQLAFLENLEKNLEGFNQSVKAVVKESKKGLLSGIHGPVSRVIAVPEQYAVAIETALGAAMQNIVTETENDAKKAIEFLKRKDAGRATFLPMCFSSSIKTRNTAAN